MRDASGRLMLACLAAMLPAPLLAQVGGEGQSPLSVVAGQVIDHATGQPVADADVSLALRQPGAAAPVTRLSAADGTFRFGDVAPGDYVFRVNALGYAPNEDVVAVAEQSNVHVVVSLTASAIELQPLIVETTRRPAFMDGFEERRADARRHTGFFTSDEIMALDPKYVTDVFRGVPGTTLVPAPGLVGGDLLRLGGDIGAPRGCLPNIFLNGVNTTGNEIRYVSGGEVSVGIPINELYPPEDIAAIEIYALDHNVPSRFQTFAEPDKCGALVIWLKEGAEGRRFADTWKRLLAAVAAVSALLLLTN